MKNFNDKLILIGLMGAGKTTLGRQMAQRLDYRFYDSDHEIAAAAGVPIPTIFEMEGERGFRSRETAILKKLIVLPHIVLSTGGGAVLKEENRALIRKSGTVVYLRRPKPCSNARAATTAALCCKLPILWGNCANSTPRATPFTAKPPTLP